MEAESRYPQNRRFRQIWVDAMRVKQPQTRHKILGCLATVAVAAAGLFCWYADAHTAQASQPTALASGVTGMISHVLDVEGRSSRVIVIDPALRVMAVYEIGREKGEIKFLSSRNLSYDMQMLGFNSTDPSPEDIKKTLEMQ